MNLQTFTAELAKLTAIPEEQTAQALEVAEGLNEADRAKFFEQLKQADVELAQALTMQSQAIGEFEAALMDAQKQMNRVERSSVESVEKRKEVQKAEKSISDLPATA